MEYYTTPSVKLYGIPETPEKRENIGDLVKASIAFVALVGAIIGIVIIL